MKKKLIGGVVILALIVSLAFFLGVFDITRLKSNYEVNDYLSFSIAAFDSQNNAYYDCKMGIDWNNKPLYVDKTGYLCGNNPKVSCFDTTTFLIGEDRIGSNRIDAYYICNCKTNSLDLSCIQGNYIFSDTKTFTVNQPTPPPSNTCKYVDGSSGCVGGDFVSYSCDTKSIIVCGYGKSCSSSKGCYVKETPSPIIPPSTKICYLCDVNYNIISEEVESCSPGYSDTQPVCQAPPNIKTCYKCETIVAGTVIGVNLVSETVETCSTGYSETKPKCELIVEDCDILTPQQQYDDVECRDNLGLFTRIWFWITNLFILN